MMTLSQSTGYAINALTCIAEHRGEPVLIRDIAQLAEIPAPYLAKLMPKLAAAGLVQSKRGFNGGVKLARDPGEITVFEIVEAIDGQSSLNECLLGMAVCSDERACPTHEFWKGIRKQIEGKLRATTLIAVSEFQTRKKRERANCAESKTIC